jgi:hypothetical protein
VDGEQLTVPARLCDACGDAELIPFTDVGDIPVETGTHFASEAEAVASPLGRVVLAYCPRCAYVRNVAFEPSLIDPTAPVDMNLYHSATFRAFSSGLVAELASRLSLRGKRVVEVGCAQGEFLRELCEVGGCTGVGYDPSYDGPEGPDPSGASLHRGVAPSLPGFDVVVSRFVLEHVADPLGFLAALRRDAGDRAVAGHFQVPDAGYDLATAGWEVIYPHVSYFNASAMCSVLARAGWTVDGTGPLFSGMIRYADVSTGKGDAAPLDLTDARDRQIAAVQGFEERHHAERKRWRSTVTRLADEGARPVLWGAGSRGVQLLNFADPDRRFAAVVDVNPAKWGRYLPGPGHRVDEPASLAGQDVRAVVITNPVYKSEIAASLAALGLDAEILTA